MLYIPLIGGPFDGTGHRCVHPVPEIYRPRTIHDWSGDNDFQPPLRGRHHIYRLSACHKRYLHESMVGEG